MYTFKTFLTEQAGQLHPNMSKLSLKRLTQPNELARGLMHVEHLPYNEGLLFEHPQEDRLSFWAKNCQLPIDLAYVNSNGIIGELHTLIPGDETHVVSAKPYKYAIEVNKGWFDANSISIGTKVL